MLIQSFILLALFLGRLSPLSSLPVIVDILFPVIDKGFLNRENDRRNDFMINLHKSYVAEMGFEHVTPGSAVSLVWLFAICT